jgi:hypothetical protein
VNFVKKRLASFLRLFEAPFAPQTSGLSTSARETVERPEAGVLEAALSVTIEVMPQLGNN